MAASGTDALGNKYYRSKRKHGDGRERRWVIYNGYAEPSTVPPSWHGWLHHTVDVPPTEQNYKPPAWQKPHRPNMTGTADAYRPAGSILTLQALVFDNGSPKLTRAIELMRPQDEQYTALREQLRRYREIAAAFMHRPYHRMPETSFAMSYLFGLASDGPEGRAELARYCDRAAMDVDAAGRIHVLDASAYRVVVFDSAGHHLRTLGAEGGGPGEMRDPAAVSVRRDGSVAVADFARSALLSWDSAGRLQPEIPVPPLHRDGFRPFALIDQGLAVTVSAPGDGDAYWWQRLLLISGEDSAVVGDVRRPVARVADLGCVQFTMEPHFTPGLRWAARGDRVVAVTGATYEIRLVAGDRRLRIRRDLPPQPVTRDLALRKLDEGLTIRFGPGSAPCVVSAERLVDEVGVAPLLPTIVQLALSPDGTLWVARQRVGDEPELIDVFDADGAYLGTLRDIPFRWTWLLRPTRQ